MDTIICVVVDLRACDIIVNLQLSRWALSNTVPDLNVIYVLFSSYKNMLLHYIALWFL